MKKIRQWFYQKIANGILAALATCPTHQVQFWYELGMMLDIYCIEMLDIHLN